MEKERAPDVGSGDAGGVSMISGGGVSLAGEHSVDTTLLVELFLRKYLPERRSSQPRRNRLLIRRPALGDGAVSDVAHGKHDDGVCGFKE